MLAVQYPPPRGKREVDTHRAVLLQRMPRLTDTLPLVSQTRISHYVDQAPEVRCMFAKIIGVWRSPVARLLWEQDVAGSNPVTPTSGRYGEPRR